MNCAQAILTLFLLAPCDEGSGGHEAIRAAVADPARPAADSARDPLRKPVDVLTFFGIEPGMHVLDVFAGGGYYTQILSAVVGARGRVISHNNGAYMDFVGQAYEARFADAGLPNVARVVAELDDIVLEPGSLDAALLILTWHDFLYGSSLFEWPDVDEAALVAKLCDAMKPGAVLGIVDHVANPGGDPSVVAETVHRIDPALVKSALQGTCFRFDGETDALRNPDDDHTTDAFQGPLRGQTDRFVYRFARDE